MKCLGDKIASLIISQSVQVPTVSWSGSNLTTSSTKNVDNIYHLACVRSNEEAVEKSKSIGFPLMLKASEGGGGKGIRKVKCIGEISDAYGMITKEVPNSPVFLMKCLENVRHLEIQVVADKYGNIATLSGRDCTLQRRHQKLVEEGPITVADHGILSKLEFSSMKLMKFINYHGAGTVEFLFLPETNEFFFLEINPRLQVEHPVTEVLIDANLPSIQLLIGAKINLNEY
jgi:acetyl-CoA carboxylase/biotin carboxylase 1